MNLVKAFCLTYGTRDTFDQAQHGLSSKLRTGGKELADAYLEAYPTPNRENEPNNFAEFMAVLSRENLPARQEYDIKYLLPQIVPGHRLWAKAEKKLERFIAIHDINYWQDGNNQNIWLCLYFIGDDLYRLGVTHQRLVTESGLAELGFREVSSSDQYENRDLICLEQITPLAYDNSYPADHLLNLSGTVRHALWTTVLSTPPYRRYYVYLCPGAERPYKLPQLLSIYAIAYYLGSITRYRPHQYDNLEFSPYGPRIQDFVTGQPVQFLYLMASEFIRQDVTKPAIL
jgi:hypothetical protein